MKVTIDFSKVGEKGRDRPMKFFTADLHLGHKNIIDYCDRPFVTLDGHPDVDAMYAAFARNWDSVVKPSDEVFILGDLGFDVSLVLRFLRERPGQKFIAWGNHDPKKPADRARFKEVAVKTGDILETDFFENGQKQKIVMCHYPMLRWNKGHFGSWMLHGHTHGSLCGITMEPPLKLVDVGVDVWNYTPVSLDELKSSLDQIFPPKHHYYKERK